MTLFSNLKNKIKKFFDKLKYKRTGSSDEISDVEIMEDYDYDINEQDDTNNDALTDIMEPIEKPNLHEIPIKPTVQEKEKDLIEF